MPNLDSPKQKECECKFTLNISIIFFVFVGCILLGGEFIYPCECVIVFSPYTKKFGIMHVE
jgi:hypothetical protein